MDALGWVSAHLVGHSMGGLIALEVALTARARVRSLSLLSSFPRGRDALSISRKILWTGLRSRIGSKVQRRSAFLEIVLPSSALVGTDRARPTRSPGSTANMRERSECCVRIAIFNRGADKLDQFSDHRIG